MMYVSFKFFSLLNGEDSVIDLVSENVARDIKESLEFLIKENRDIKNVEVELVKKMMFELFMLNYDFLPKQKEIIKEKVFKTVDHKINWILKQRS